jgi:LacI family transcriptional regulator
MRVSIREVASRAGVSVGTASNVLNRPDVVAPATAERVRSAMRELGFVRSDNARHLRSGTARTVGLVVMDVSNPFFTDIARGVEDAANAAGLAVILCNSDDRADKEDAYLALLEEQRVRGVVITPVDPGSPHLERLRASGIPVVLVDTKTPKHVGCSVSVDDLAGGDLAVEYLISLGHRRITFISGPLHFKQCRDRLAGARRAIRRAGLDRKALTVVDAGGLNVAAGRKGAEEATRAGEPTALFCANDLLAIGAIQFAQETDIAIPGRVSIIGYDDIEFATTVSLSSIRQPRQDLGVAGTELLLAEASEHPHAHRQVIFNPELVIRGSTGPQRRS